MACPDESQLAAFAQRLLSPEAARLIERHVEECSECRQVVAGLIAAQTSAAIERTVVTPGVHTSVPALETGRRLGRYVVLERLGAGGMGVVYAAYDPQLDRKVALKLLHRGGEEARARLLREAQAAARLTNPNVITVHDVGEFGDEIFLASEFVDGGTLADWLAAHPPPRNWKEVLPLFLAAGRGLAAAHERKVVHRDVKPANVLLGRDGRVLVSDFGLSIASSLDSAEANDDLRLTATGALLGTPAYMAPEQWQGREADARSDQFSFCVALCEGLYGARPFAGHTPTELKDSVLGARFAFPAGADVPRWLRAALTRGLEQDPSLRWPSMNTLLAALSHDPAARVRRGLTFAAAAVTVLALPGALWWSGERTARSCRAGASRLDAVWNANRRSELQRAVTATNAVTAAAAWDGTARAIDAWSTGWREEWTDACEATHVRAQQSAELLDLRLDCLNDRLAELGAFATLLGTADARMVEQATAAAQKLSPPAVCSAAALGRSRLKPPRDAAERQQVNEVRELLSKARAADLLGRPAVGRDLARDAVNASRQCGYLPVRAEALFIHGATQHRAGDPPAVAAATLHEAIYVAAEGDDDAVEAGAWGMLVRVLSIGGKPDEAHDAARHAEAILKRAGTDRERADLATNLGELLVNEGKPAEALPQYQAAGELYLKLGDGVNSNGAQVNIGRALDRLGRFPEANTVLRRALAGLEQIHGPTHPNVAIALNNLASNALQQGLPEEALGYAQRAVNIREQTLGPKHMLVGRALGNLARVLEAQGRLDDAQAAYERVRDISAATMGPEHPSVADPIGDLGRLALRRDRLEEARALFEKALAIREKGQSPTHPDLGRALLDLAALERAEGNAAHAQERLSRAAALLEKGGPDQLAELELARGEQSLALAQAELADRHFAASLEARRKSAGERSPRLREPLIARANAALASGRIADALARLDEAQALPGKDDALLRATRAHALWSSDRPAADALLAAAKEEWTRSGDALRLRELDAWRPPKSK